MKVSIILVHYKAQKELFECLETVQNSLTSSTFEVIVVDNDEHKTIQKELSKYFPTVKYIQSARNIGYGGANNLGASKANGEYLFFLNPDTKIAKNTINTLTEFLDKHETYAIVAPLLTDQNHKPYQQGTTELTPVKALISLSFINKIFPNNPISKKYFLNDWDQKDTRDVDVVPGTAFMIRRNIFNKVNGFDHQFFLYFEEFDLCKRIKALKYKMCINPNATVVHLGARSTGNSQAIQQIFNKSRFLYFKKNYGIIWANIVELFANFGRYESILLVALVFGAFLRFYRINEMMGLIGDQGWFYLSAKDMIINHKIPLVGITSSHTWLHQGPLWTYILAIIFLLFNFNPLAPAYITVLIDLITIWFLYKVATDFFSKRVGIIASLFYAGSPAVIAIARMPYHTSLIAFFILLFMWSNLRWIRGHSVFFPVTLFSLAILYNLELATNTLWIIFTILVLYGIKNKEVWMSNLLTKRIIITSCLAFILPMLPIFIYDIFNGFKQTVVFAGWIVYKIVSFLIHSHPNSNGAHILDSMIMFFMSFLQRLFFLPNQYIAISLFILTGIYFSLKLCIDFKKKQLNDAQVLLYIMTFIPMLGLFINQTPSDAYLPILIPPMIISTAYVIDTVFRSRRFDIPIYVLLVSTLLLNGYYLINTDYFISKGHFFKDKVRVARQIISEANEQPYSLIGTGPGSEFSSFTNDIEYLTWYFGNQPQSTPQKLTFTIIQEPHKLKVIKKVN